MEASHDAETEMRTIQTSSGPASMDAGYKLANAAQILDIDFDHDTALKRRQNEFPDVITIPPIFFAVPTSTSYIATVVATPIAVAPAITLPSPMIPMIVASTTNIPTYIYPFPTYIYPFPTSEIIILSTTSLTTVPVIFTSATPEATRRETLPNPVLTFPTAAAATITAMPTSSTLRFWYSGSTFVTSTSRAPQYTVTAYGPTNSTKTQFDTQGAKPMTSKQIAGISIGGIIGVIALAFLVAGWVFYMRHERARQSRTIVERHDSLDKHDAIYGVAGEKKGASGKVFQIRQLFRGASLSPSSTLPTGHASVPWRKPSMLTPATPDHNKRLPPRIVVATEVNRPYPLSILDEFAASPSASSSSDDQSPSQYSSTDMELPFRLGSPVREGGGSSRRTSDHRPADAIGYGETAHRLRPPVTHDHRNSHAAVVVLNSHFSHPLSLLPALKAREREIGVSRNSMQARFERAGRIELNSPYDEGDSGARYDGQRSARTRVYNLFARLF